MIGRRCNKRPLPVVFHVLNILQQCLLLPGLMIDNRIAVVANDCYTRISVGSKLSEADIVSQLEVAGLSECEKQCSKNEPICNSFAFGVGLKGNGTCAISTRVPMLEDLVAHPDYDVYLKKQGPPWCDDYPYNNGFQQENESHLTKQEKSNKNGHVVLVGDLSSESIKEVSQPLHTQSLPRYSTTSYGLVGIYDRFVDHDGRFLSGDDNHRVLDILANRNQKPASSNPLEGVHRESFGNPSHPRLTGIEKTKNHLNEFYFSASPPFSSTQFNTHNHPAPAKIVQERVLNRHDKTVDTKIRYVPHTSGITRIRHDEDAKVPKSENVTLKTQQKFEWNKSPLTLDFPICHRKMQPGMKTMELHVQRAINCDNLHDCRRTCDYEKTFDCKGFNYRSGSGGSTGVCELTATPYYRMNVDRDFLMDPRYDYYERNRNCPPSTWATTQWTDQPRVYDQNRQGGSWSRLDHKSTNEDLPGPPNYPESYPTNQEFPGRFPGENVQNWNGPIWQNPELHYPGPIYDNSVHDAPINYNKEFSNERPSIFPKHRPEDRSEPQDFNIPRETDQIYGKFHNYGSAFGYNDNFVPTAKEIPYEEHQKSPRAQKCSVRSAAGSKLSRSVLRKTCLARDLMQCEDLCVNESAFSCGSFAYRYNVLNTNPTDNCLLSDLPHQDLNFYTDLEPDRDYDSYVIIQDTKVCLSKKATNQYPEEECFSRVRSGFGIPADVTKKSMHVDDLGECQFACTMSQEFVCRSFVFKYGMEEYNDHVHGHGQDRASTNCFLSDWPPGDINPTNMPDMDGAELYERSSFSYGCEAYPVPLAIPDVATPHDRLPNQLQMDELCYSQHYRPCKLMAHAIMSSTRADSKSECRQKCSTMRNTGAIPPCMSFNYMIASDNTRDNCMLSEIPIRDLRPNVDYIQDDDHLLYAWRDLDPYCASVPEEHNQPFPPAQDHHTHGVFDDGTHPLESDFHPPFPTRNKFRPGNNEDHQIDNVAGSRPVSDGFEQGFDFLYPRRELSTFQHYTVNGHPCKNGTVCQRNEVVDFWSCETEGSEYGSWDYCCNPNHKCGFSHGYHYPWCYVGSNEDQWRPCSEKYYPYYLSKDHATYGQSSARHWPIMYLHKTLPPNCTINPNSQSLSQNHRLVVRANGS
ncbi:uncharacterized protein LOC128892909 isoform X3 [Hylaeus anthracinus]|uniref:uncharacterized protein LOC128892909 isoform X3 n=1 Tax=Hylaeus anthracinus TaxID=313031 RepID=UPI0023B9DC6C|nr:uncharacterized protein LOC128892909 isoform X3 [Hylaeus anthracinus]